MVQSGDIIGYFKSKHFRDIVLKEMLKMISNKGDIKIKEFAKLKKNTSKKMRTLGITNVALSSSVDLHADEIVDNLIKGDAKNLDIFMPVKKVKGIKVIAPLSLFLDEEILLYAKLRGLQFKEIKIKKDNIEIFLDEFEKKHPEVKRAVVNSLLELYKKN